MNYKNKFLVLAMIGVFMFSVNAQVATVSAQSGDIETNFELLLMTNAGNRIRESYAFFIKQAVAPLGIDVQILAKPFGQFVGDLLHVSTGQPFDLAIIGFSGGGPFPDLMWKFHSTRTSFGQVMYQLNDPTWQQFQESDTGVTTAEVDKLLESIDFELDPLTRLSHLTEFAQLYMDKLLYDLPLTTPTSRVAMWKGFGGSDNALWDVDEGAWSSSWLGAKWTDATPQERLDEADKNTLQFRAADPAKPGNFDPYQSFDTSTTAQTTYLLQSLLSYDGAYAPHPGVAYQWFVEDVKYDADNNASTPDSFVEKGKHTFILNDAFKFAATTDKDGNAVAAKAVDANDVKLALDLLKEGSSRHVSINGLEQYIPIVKYEVSTTVTTDDTISIWLAPGETKPGDYVTLGALNPLPSHILGGDLHLANGTTFKLGDGTTFNPQQSLEWKHWASQDGNTQVGPMKINEYKYQDAGFWSFTARDDYPFPNEMDAIAKYDANKAAFDTLYSSLNTTGWSSNAASNLRTFAPHTAVNDEPYYWAYNNGQKPTTQSITDVVVKVIPDTNAALLAFESGALDQFGSSALGANTVAEHEKNPNYVVKESVPLSGPVLLVFNLLNEHLQKRNVRYAIASVLDKQEMTKINDGFSTPQHSPVWLVYDRFAPLDFKGAGPNGEDLSWYVPFPIPYDYAKGRDLMREEGYKAQDSANVQETAKPAPVNDVLSTIGGVLGSNALIGLSAFAITAVVLVRRNRRY